jgi:hypothetical protein
LRRSRQMPQPQHPSLVRFQQLRAVIRQITGNSDRRDKRREALGNFTSASSYYFNVNRTSLDHLLLGKNADVDKNVEYPEYTAGPERCQRKRFLKLWFWAAKASYR